jgi:hypothetical protein
MDILAERSMDAVIRLPDDTLRSALAFHYAVVSDEERNWVHMLFESHPLLTAEVLEHFWRVHLLRDCEHIEGLYSLPYDERMASIARRVSVQLLQSFPNCRFSHLRNLLNAALRHCNREELLELCRQALRRASGVRGEQRTLWYATGFALSPDEFSEKVKHYVGRDQGRAETLLGFLFPSWPEQHPSHGDELPISALATLISICGPILKNFNGIDSPTQNVRGLIDRIAADTSPEAADILQRLKTQGRLTDWRELLTNAVFQQRRKSREEMFRYPTSSQVNATLSTGPPANPADLQALVYDHLLIIREDIHHGSTDSYKAFWNINSRGRLVAPRIEDECRNRLLERLRERLAPLGLTAEPEGHYRRDKRSDIKVLYRSELNLPIEIKRHYHKDLWTAPTRQLGDLYTQDPGAGGRGIYLVFWFGIAPGRRLPRPPGGIQRPASPADLEKTLVSLLPEESPWIEVIVIDCSEPSD